jgi:hypothetical protein
LASQASNKDAANSSSIRINSASSIPLEIPQIQGKAGVEDAETS